MAKKKGVLFLDELNKTGAEFQKKLNAQTYLQIRKNEVAALVREFNTKHKNSIVYLKATEDGGSFQLHLALYDRFVENKYYDDGTAIAYFSDAVYTEIQKLAGDREVHWNNTKSTGWLSFQEGY